MAVKRIGYEGLTFQEVLDTLDKINPNVLMGQFVKDAPPMQHVVRLVRHDILPTGSLGVYNLIVEIEHD